MQEIDIQAWSGSHVCRREDTKPYTGMERLTCTRERALSCIQAWSGLHVQERGL